MQKKTGTVSRDYYKKSSAFVEELNHFGYNYQIIEFPMNEIPVYNIRFFPGKESTQRAISNKFLRKYVRKQLPLVFPHIVISGWAPWIGLYWERFTWKSDKHRHTPEYSDKLDLKNQFEEEFYLRLADYVEQAGFNLLDPEDAEVTIKNAGPLSPWCDEKDISVSDILFNGLFIIHTL